MTPLRWIARAFGGIAGLSLLAALALLAFIPAASADLKRGVAAYNRGDYPTALRELESAARGGNADAQYYVSTMYAEGRGTPRQDVLALKWLNCAAEGSGGMLVKAKAKFWRTFHEILNSEVAEAGRALAVSACGIDSGEAVKTYYQSRAESEMDRSNWLMNLLLYPGDMIIQAFLGLGEGLSTDWIGRAFVQLFEWMGDVFPGVLAVVAWGGIWRLLFISFESASRGMSMQGVAGYRSHKPLWRKKKKPEPVRKGQTEDHNHGR